VRATPLFRADRPAFLLVEALLGIAIFALTVVGAYRILLLGQGGSIEGGDRIRATLLAERTIEAAKAIRDGSFSALTAGTHGIAVGSNGKWTLSGSKLVTSDGFTTTLTVSSLESDWIRLMAVTSWNHGVNGSGSVALVAELTDWGASLGGNWSSITLEGSYVDSGTPLFNDIAVYGNYAFVSSETSGGGVGLYVFDISNLASPSRVASTFDLGAPGYDVAVRGSRLYIAVGSVGDEIRVYDISSPTTLSSAHLVTSYNLPGSSRARAMLADGTRLYVGANESATGGEDEFYVFDISSSGSILLQDSLDESGSVGDIAIRGTGAFLASSMDVSELRVVNITTPTNIFLIGGYNLTDVQDGIAALAFGTGTIIGRVDGAAIDELVKFSVGKSAVPTSPGPWYREMGGNVNAAAVEPAECAGFFATTNTTKELQIVNVYRTSLAELTSYDTDTGDGRGLLYDASRDRVYLLTNKALLIFKPAAGPWACP
jgi:hypothetical protein